MKFLLKTHFNGKKDELLETLPSMIDDPGVRSQRMEQITICIELEKYCAGADAMLRLRDMFNLTGDFLDIETLSKAVNICEISVMFIYQCRI